MEEQEGHAKTPLILGTIEVKELWRMLLQGPALSTIPWMAPVIYHVHWGIKVCAGEVSCSPKQHGEIQTIPVCGV
jgi:hypothetical protein